MLKLWTCLAAGSCASQPYPYNLEPFILFCEILGFGEEPVALGPGLVEDKIKSLCQEEEIAALDLGLVAWVTMGWISMGCWLEANGIVKIYPHHRLIGTIVSMRDISTLGSSLTYLVTTDYHALAYHYW